MLLSLLLCSALLSALAQAIILSTQDRWIVDPSNKRVKLRCVNWAGHGETNIPEGLHAQTPDFIAGLIQQGGFNCIRLTYSIDMALNPSQSVADSFTKAASSTGQSSLSNIYNSIKTKNPSIASGTTRGAFEAVVKAVNAKGLLVVLDNHVSRAKWCCGTADGNGWWKQASGYNAANSQYFDASDWVKGLGAMATWSKSFSNIVGLSLRNELRAVSGQDGNSHADWYNYQSQGARAIHQANPNALVVIGGTNYATDLSFIYNKNIDKSGIGIANKLVWEAHSYQWSNSQTGNCPAYTTSMGNAFGYLLTSGKAYTGPLWLSEFGWNQNSMSQAESTYWNCLRTYLEGNDTDWAYWALQGSYYIREGTVDYDESFGMLKRDWSGWRNSGWKNTFGSKIFQTNQGP